MGWQALYPDGMHQTFDDEIVMVLVPEGCFYMGSASGYEDELPLHEQCFESSFWIDETEVTQTDFFRLGGVQADQPDFQGDDRPIESINFLEAESFCALRSARLPIESEWEYAARGPDGWVYPWGNDWNDSHVVSNRISTQGTAEVKSLPRGRSWVGAYDMSGNVWEWVNSRYLAYDVLNEVDAWLDKRWLVIRGGAWYVRSFNLLRASSRYAYYAYSLSNYGVGFRCVRSF